MANGVKLNAAKQITIDETQPVWGQKETYNIGPPCAVVQFSPASQIRSTLSIEIHKIFHIRSTQN